MTTTHEKRRSARRHPGGWLLALAIAAVLPGALAAQTPIPVPQPPRPEPLPGAAAQPAAIAQPTVGPPIQRIESATALSAEALGAVTSVRELPDGRVLVNDGTRRRLLLMDTALTTVAVVLDSLSAVANTYGTRPGALLPFRGDTTLFVDPASFAMVVLDPSGNPVRVRSVWRVQDVNWATNSAGLYGFPGIDARGRIVYRIGAQPAPPRVPPPAGIPYFPPQPDSAFIVAVDLDTRKADTLGVLRIPKTEMRARRVGEGGSNFIFESLTNPLPATDHWAVLPDGTVAFIRWQDYRVEYLRPDGTLTSSAKLPYEWQRLSDDDKQILVDSVKVAQETANMRNFVLNMIVWSNRNGRPYPQNFTVPDGFTMPPGLPRDWILPTGLSFPENYVYACAPGEEPPAGAGAAGAAAMMVVAGVPGAAAARTQGVGPPVAPGAPPGAAAERAAVAVRAPGADGAAPAAAGPACLPSMFGSAGAGSAAQPPSLRTAAVMSAAELPDYRPPLMSGAAGAVRADMEGNLWIRTVPVRPIPGGPVYDIVSREGELVNRIQLPPGYTLVGFGRDKVVYLSMRDPTGLKLARVRLR